MGSSFALPRPGSWLRSGACPFEASTGSPDRRPICPSSGRLQAMRRGTTPRRAMSALVAVGCVAGLGAGVAGCSGDPGPTTTTTVTEEPSPSPTPTPTPTPDASVKPERPAAMDVADSAGAEAAVVYFLQLLPYAFATNGLEELRAIGHPECVYCANVTSGIEEQAAASRYAVGGLDTITGVNSTEVESGRWWTVDVDLVQAPSQTLDQVGTVIEDFPDTVGYHMD